MEAESMLHQQSSRRRFNLFKLHQSLSSVAQVSSALMGALQMTQFDESDSKVTNTL